MSFMCRLALGPLVGSSNSPKRFVCHAIAESPLHQSERAKARQDRLKRFTLSAHVREDDPRFSAIIKSFKKDKHRQQAAKENSKLALAIANAQKINGPDLYIDRYLRHFVSEYNNRLFMGEGIHMPTSYNIVSSFIEPDERAYVLRVLPEIHYALSFDAILNHLTDPSVDATWASVHEEMDELKVYCFNALGGYANFSIPGNEDYAFCGTAFVREDSHIAIMTLLGRKNSSRVSRRMQANECDIAPEKQFLVGGKDSFDLSDEFLFENDLYSPLILLSRINAINSTLESRYVLQEKKDIFQITTDDPQTIKAMVDAKGWDLSIQKKICREMLSYDGLFEISHSLISCLDFLQSDRFVVERHPTFAHRNPNKSIVREVRSKLGLGDVPNFVEVLTLPDLTQCDSTYELSAAPLKIETKGYWRTLAMDKVGRDRNGRPIQGKTWVATTESWFEEFTSSLSANSVPVEVRVAKDDTEGEIYVVRSAMHHRDIYKVGYTTVGSDERSRQLGATSGQPDTFNVVQTWRVRSPRLIEGEIHRRLSKYRVNDKREFFQAKYPVIREVIEAVVEKSGLAQQD